MLYTLGRALSFCGDPLAVAIPISGVSAWKHAMDAMSRCVAFVHGAHGRKGHVMEHWPQKLQGDGLFSGMACVFVSKAAASF